MSAWSNASAERMSDAQHPLRFVEEVDRKRVEAHDAPEQLVNLGEELVEIEDRGDLLREIGQRQEQFLIAGRGASRFDWGEMRHRILGCPLAPGGATFQLYGLDRRRTGSGYTRRSGLAADAPP
jgi:hypothetical protein